MSLATMVRDLGEEDLAYTRIAIHFMQLCVDSSDIPSRIAMRICRFLEKAEIQDRHSIFRIERASYQR